MSQNNSRVVFFFSGAIFVAPWLWFQICGGGAGMNKNTNFSILLELKFFPEKVVGINDIWKQIKKFILICTTTLWTLVCPLVPRRLIVFTFIKKVTWATALREPGIKVDWISPRSLSKLGDKLLTSSNENLPLYHSDFLNIWSASSYQTSKNAIIHPPKTWK